MTCGFKLEAIGVEGACGMAKAAPSPSGPAVASDGCLLKGAKRSPPLLTWMQVDQTIFHKVVGGGGGEQNRRAVWFSFVQSLTLPWPRHVSNCI